jgi:hypothetical protein
MMWTFERDRQQLTLEVRGSGSSGEWEMILYQPNGNTVVEQFGRRELLQAYLNTVQDTLRELRWTVVGSDENSTGAAGRIPSPQAAEGGPYSQHGAIANEIRSIPETESDVFDLSDVPAEIPKEWGAGALYTLEYPARCPHCREPLNNVRVLRLKRAQVAFTSTLPRTGSVIVCPLCEKIISAELSGLL